jgi:hypothetical protein
MSIHLFLLYVFVFIGPCPSREGPYIVLEKRHMVKMSCSYLTPSTLPYPRKMAGLTPKIPCVFLPNSTVFDIVGKSISQKI